MLTGWEFNSLNDFFNMYLPVNNSPVSLELCGCYVCDCLEYDFVAFFRKHPLFSYSQPFDHMYCSCISRHIVSAPLNTLPLIDMVCSVLNDCPSPCKCIKRPHNKALQIECQNSFLRYPPLDVPSSNQGKYKLDFSNSRQFQLQPRPYFHRAAILDASDCDLNDVDEVTWMSIAGVDSVFLHNNQLETLPTSIIRVNVSIKYLSLFNNSWRCSCGNSWLKAYLKSIKENLINPDEIICKTPARLNGKGLLYVTDEEFCEDPAMRMLKITLLSVGCGLLVILLLCLLTYRCRIRIHDVLKIHSFDRDECEEEPMEYDVFLCFAQNDSAIARKLLSFLESRNYKVCYHLRDFLAGEVITENICRAVKTSKRTLCLLSKHFLRSAYCIEEFNIAMNISLRKRGNRLIVVALQPLTELEDMASIQSLLQYVSNHTYLEYLFERFRERLLYALPQKTLETLHA